MTTTNISKSHLSRSSRTRVQKDSLLLTIGNRVTGICVYVLFPKIGVTRQKTYEEHSPSWEPLYLGA